MIPQRKMEVVLVTGCTKGGIGFALCEEYSRRGCKVYATARRLESMEGFADPGIEKLALDVTNDQNVLDVVKTVIEKEGRIDIVVNNAGANCAGTIIDVPLDAVQHAFDANFFSVLRVTKAVFPYMAARKSGTIVNIGSVVGEMPTAWNGIYASTKAALHRVSDVLWLECKPFNITVTLISPGAVKSNIANNAVNSIHMPEDSLYRPYRDSIVARIMASQGPNSMPGEEFARLAVNATLAEKPPRFISIGGGVTMWKIFTWLPKTLVLLLLWRRFLKVPK